MTAPLVLVTRPAGSAGPLVDALIAGGHRVIAAPTVTTRPVAHHGPLDQALAAPAGWDWIVVTSPTGARAVIDAMTRTSSAQDGVRWAAVGPATAAAIRARGIEVDLAPTDATGVEIARALIARGDIVGSRILLPRADAASSDLPTALGAAGAEVHDVVAYHTVEAPPESAEAVIDALRDADLAAIVVASGSAVRGLIALADAGGLAERARRVPLVVIGPSTATVARDFGAAVVIQAESPSIESLLAAVAVALTTTLPLPVFAGGPNDPD